MADVLPNCAKPTNKVAESIRTRTKPISSDVRKRVSTKKVVTKPIATPVYVAIVPRNDCRAMIPIAATSE